ncbi:acyltransferase family protein [Lysinibacillus fusiformis]|uniref:acyltransferase family protein n=1 Tax=Lysinibacillus fusiformis TaxID=28031 RepID=UPI00215B0143|nr:acyltransferase [Lysinibacillus fusiformis]MCR8854074.1 acyltransferase [Lysinibacillus fusiformis]
MAYLYQPGLMDTSRIYFGTDTRAFALLIGAALAVCLPSKMFEGKVAINKYLRISLDVAGGISSVILFWLIWQTHQYEAFLYHGGMVIQCIASAVVVAAAVHPSPWITRILGYRLFQWLGIRSYGIYIWHYPVLVLFFPLSDGDNSISHILIQIGITLLIASISWRFIEQPIRYGDVGSMFRRIWRFGGKEFTASKK